MNVSELSGRVKIFSLVKDEDGSISRVPICLCELCRVNHFLCSRYASHSSAGEAVLDELEGKYIHQMHVEIKTGYPQKGDILDWVISELRKTRNTLRQQGERDRE